ncbi:translation initiation factor SUI1 [Phyllosticta capitalensis]|uniref:Translation initiation factor SUI1 n=1 Tax=Phyllosticta capitalensis TaxID=121624 RepID=A0ABR1YHI4_9PEZI
MASQKKDMRRDDLVIPYTQVESKSDPDFAGTMSSTLPMAAIFTRNKMVGWAAVIFALQTWLAETPESKSAASTPGIFSVGMSFMSLLVDLRYAQPRFTQPLVSLATDSQHHPAKSLSNVASRSTRLIFLDHCSLTSTVTLTPSADPFAEADEDTGETKQSQNYIHIRIQQRNGRKTLTTVQGLPKKFDQKKILKVIKKKFACNGTIVHDSEMGEVIQLQGDQRKDVQEFLTDKKEGLELDAKTIKVHGF